MVAILSFFKNLTPAHTYSFSAKEGQSHKTFSFKIDISISIHLIVTEGTKSAL